MLALGSHDESWGLFLLTSDDGGDDFAEAVTVVPETAGLHSHGENGPGLAAWDQDALYAIWEQPSRDGHMDVMVGGSADFGSTVSRGVRVTDTDPAKEVYSGYASLSLASATELHAAWLDWRGGDQAASIYAARSLDGGGRFQPNVLVASNVCPCCRPSVVVGPQREIVVVWRNVYPDGSRDMASSVSIDGGQTFQGPFRVAVDGWKIRGCPDSGAATVRAGRRVHVAWLTEGGFDHAGIRLTWSDDGGRTFAPPVLASASVLDANHPSMAVTAEGRVLLAFEGRPGQDGGWGKRRPWLVEIDEKGHLTEPQPIPIPPDAPAVIRPVVAAGSVGRVFMAWTERQDGQPRIMLARGRRIGP
jgi:hypothetical protein